MRRTIVVTLCDICWSLLETFWTFVALCLVSVGSSEGNQKVISQKTRMFFEHFLTFVGSIQDPPESSGTINSEHFGTTCGIITTGVPGTHIYHILE